MYNSLQLANSIKSSAKSKGVSIGELLKSCELSINTMSNLNHGKSIAFDSLAKIADYLNVSVDYLLGRADSPEINNQTISGNASITAGNINGNNNNSISNANTTVNGTQCNNLQPAEKSADNIDETAEQVARAFQSLNIMNKAKVLTLLAQLTEAEKTA